MTEVQNERAFQKQDGVFLSSKKVMAKKTASGVRFYKKIGLGKFAGPRPFTTEQERVCRFSGGYG